MVEVQEEIFMGIRNPLFTGWQDKGHLIDEPTKDITLLSRLDAAQVGNFITPRDMKEYGPLGLPAPKRSKKREDEPFDLPSSYEAYLVQVCPGLQGTIREMEDIARKEWFRFGGIAHLLEIATFHRESLRSYDTVYGIGVQRAQTDGSVFVPRLSIGDIGEGKLRISLVQQSFMPETQKITRQQHAKSAFLVLKPITRLSSLCCRECPKKS
jgi:hypothetical protein